MRFEKLDLNLLAVLDALLEERGVSATAQRLNLSQPAVSNALRRLRDYFQGDPLLVQSGRQMKLTPRAEQLAHSVRHILNLVRSEVAVQPSFDPSTADRLFVVLASDFTFEVLLLPLLRRLASNAPHVRLKLMPLGDHVRETFDRGDIDLLIAPNQIAPAEHPSEVIFSDEFVVAAWDQNPLIGDRLDIETYFALGHVTCTFGGTALPAFDEWILKNASHQRRLEIFLPGFTMVPPALIGTTRIATMHRRLASKLATTMPLRLLQVPFDCPPLKQIVQHHRLRDHDEGIKWLLSNLRDTVRDEWG